MAEKTREEKIIGKLHTVLNEAGIKDEGTIKKLVRLIMLASSTSERPTTISRAWSGVLPFDYVAGPLLSTHKVHIYGPPSAGKSALALNIANGLWKTHDMTKILLVDTTFTANKRYIENFPAEFHIVQTTELYPVIEAAGEYNIIIVDDFSGATDPQSIINLMSVCGLTNTLIIICNQIRADMKGGYYARRPGLVGMCTMSAYLKRVEKREKYTISQLKLERYRGNGTKEGRVSTLPIDYDGNILTDKVVENLLPLAKMYPDIAIPVNATNEEIVSAWISMLWNENKPQET